MRKRLILTILITAMICLSACTSVEELHEQMSSDDAEARVQLVKKIADKCNNDVEYNIYEELRPYLQDPNPQVQLQVMEEYAKADEIRTPDDLEGEPLFDYYDSTRKSNSLLQEVSSMIVNEKYSVEFREKAMAFMKGNLFVFGLDGVSYDELNHIWAKNPKDDLAYEYMMQFEDVYYEIFISLVQNYADLDRNEENAYEKMVNSLDADMIHLIHAILERERDNNTDALHYYLIEKIDNNKKRIFMNFDASLAVLNDVLAQNEYMREEFYNTIMKRLDTPENNPMSSYVVAFVENNSWMEQTILENMGTDYDMLRFCNRLIRLGYGDESLLVDVLKSADKDSIGQICKLLINHRESGTIHDEVAAQLQNNFDNMEEWVKEYVYQAAVSTPSANMRWNEDWSSLEFFEYLLLSDEFSYLILELVVDETLNKQNRRAVYDYLIENIYEGKYGLDDIESDMLINYSSNLFAARWNELFEAEKNPTLSEGVDKIRTIDYKYSDIFDDYPELDQSCWALRPDEARYIIYHELYTIHVGTYVMSDGSGSFEANRIDAKVFVIDKLTGKIIRQKKVRGDNPPSTIETNWMHFDERSTIRKDKIYDCYADFYKELS